MNRPRGELDLLELGRRLFERPLDMLLGGQLGDDRAQSGAGGDEPEGGCDGRLTDATLSSDEDKSAVKQACHGVGR